MVGSRNQNAKLDEDQVREMRRLYTEGILPHRTALTRRYNVSWATVNRIVSGQSWTHTLVA